MFTTRVHDTPDSNSNPNPNPCPSPGPRPHSSPFSSPHSSPHSSPFPRPHAPSIPNRYPNPHVRSYYKAMGFDGTADKFDQLATAYTTNNNNNNNDNSGDSPESSESLPVLVASEDSARGLHLDGVDAVFVLARPRSAGMVPTNPPNPRTHPTDEPTNPPNPTQPNLTQPNPPLCRRVPPSRWANRPVWCRGRGRVDRNVPRG